MASPTPRAQPAVPVFTATGTRSTKYERILAVRPEALPDTFTHNSVKEELVLSYVESFRKQFVQLYPDRPQLLLTPKNEANVPKFVCATLRPTQLPYKELYDMHACARFVAAYIHYEPLYDPTAVPQYLPSPYFTLQTRVGDCFDMAMVLCSFLVGAGYDAYVVSGTAPRWVTLQQEDRSRSDWVPPSDAIDRQNHTTDAALGLTDKSVTAAPPPGVSRYKIPPPPSLVSEYLKASALKAEEESKKKADAENYESEDEASDQEITRLRTEVPARPGPAGSAASIRGRTPGPASPTGSRLSTKSPRSMRTKTGSPTARIRSRSRGAARAGSSADEDEPLDANIDPLYGRRVHAWVLVRAGRREITEHAFVEPTSGAVYSVRESPYFSVESVWNHKNYYVNMQSQPVIPRQELGDSAQLVDALRATLEGTATGPVTRLEPGGLLSRMKTPASIASSRSFFDSSRAGEGVAAKFASPFAAKLDPRGVANSGLPAGAPALDEQGLLAVMKRPPLRGELTHRSDGGSEVAAVAAATCGGVTARSTSRSRVHAHVPGSVESWRKELAATQSALQTQVADILLKQAEARDLGSLSFDLSNEDDWEFVMLPPEGGSRFADEGMYSNATASGVLGREDGKEGEGKLEDSSADGVPGVDGSGTSSGVRASGSALVASQPLSSGAFANAPIELDGEHILDLPQSWVPRLAIERNLAHITLSASEAHVVHYFKGRLETFAPRRHPQHLVVRFTEYHDSSRLRPFRVTEVFGKRKDGLYKRVRHLDVQTVEEHFEKGRTGGLAMFVDVLGKRHELYFYPGARVDGLLKRVHDFGAKIMEFYGDTPSRLYYRSVSLVEGSATVEETPTLDSLRSAPTKGGHATRAGATPIAVRLPTVNIGLGQEASVRKMTEKYRRDPTGRTPAHQDMAKVVYLLEDDAIQVTFHHAPGRVTSTARLYQRSTGAMEALSVDPYAPEPRPFEIDAEFRRLHLQMEKDCHTAARGMAKTCIDLLLNRMIEESEVVAERTIFEVALERVRGGIPVEEQEKEETSKDVDYLMPFLLAVKCKDPNNPSEGEARKADKACRVAYKERLLERVSIIQRRLDEENDKLLRKQQAFSRNRDHGEGAEEEFERYCAEATFRIGILEQRLERQEELVTKKYQQLEQRLANDPRLAIIHNPAALAARRAAADSDARKGGAAGVKAGGR